MRQGLRNRRSDETKTARVLQFVAISFCQQHRLKKNKYKNKSLSQTRFSEAHYLPASLTVEAALVLPLFLLLCSLFFTFFSGQLLQLRLQRSLDEICQDVAVWSHIIDLAEDYTGQDLLSLADGGLISGALDKDSDALSALLGGQADLAAEIKLFLLEKGSALVWQPLIKEWLIARVGRGTLDASPLKDGAGGLSLSGSSLHGRELDLVLSYQVESPLRIPFQLSYQVVQRSCRRLWVGTRVDKDFGEEEAEEESSEEAICYITETGSVYHLDKGCRVLALKKETVAFSDIPSLRNTGGGKYYPCERCASQGSYGIVTVIITIPGHRYHFKEDCRNLKRTIIEISLSEAQEQYRPCGFCGGSGGGS